MKKLLGIFLISILLVSCDCGCDNYKYYITDSKGNIWGTNRYTESNGCITFKYNEETHKVCGEYTIEKNKNYKGI